MPWLPRQLTNGVVKTRSRTSLVEGELQDSAFCRLKVGNTTELAPDWAYSQVGSAYNVESVLLGRIVTFDSLADVYVLQVVTREPAITVLRIVNLDGEVQEQVEVAGTATVAALESRGAEYFIVTDLGNFVVDDSLEFRDMGLNPSEAIVEVEKDYPTIDADIWRSKDDAYVSPYTQYIDLIKDMY